MSILCIKQAEEKLTSYDIFKRLHRSIGLVDFVESRDLDKPANVVGEEFVVDHPFGQLVPFVR